MLEGYRRRGAELPNASFKELERVEGGCSDQDLVFGFGKMNPLSRNRLGLLPNL